MESTVHENFEFLANHTDDLTDVKLAVTEQ